MHASDGTSGQENEKTGAATGSVPVWRWLLLVAVVLIPLGVTIAALPSLPPTIAIHWNANGDPDGWGSRTNAVFLPASAIPLSLLFGGLAHALGKRSGSQKTERTIFWSGFAVLCAWGFLALVVLGQTSGAIPALNQHGFNVATISTGLIGLLSTILGNAAPATPMNHWFGFRTRAAYQSPAVWAKTQMFGGRLMVVAGIMTLIAAFFLPSVTSLIVMCILLLGVVVAVAAYSSRIAHTERAAGNSSGQHAP